VPGVARRTAGAPPRVYVPALYAPAVCGGGR